MSSEKALLVSPPPQIRGTSSTQILPRLVRLHLPDVDTAIELETKLLVDTAHRRVRVGVFGAHVLDLGMLPQQEIGHGRLQPAAETAVAVGRKYAGRAHLGVGRAIWVYVKIGEPGEGAGRLLADIVGPALTTVAEHDLLDVTQVLRRHM